jgi:cardiolipin synthase
LIFDDATLVNTIESLFEADLKGKTYDVRTLIPAALSEILTVSPQSEKPLVDFINSAQVSIDLEAQYLKEPAINQAILERAQNGVKVSVTVASPCAFGTPSKGETTQINTIYSEFDKVGISSRMFNASNRINGKRGYMHAKAMVLDGNRAWLGSENGSSASLNENREYGVIFDRAAWVETLLTTMTGDHEDPASESWEDSLTCKNERPNGNRMDMSDFFTSPN